MPLQDLVTLAEDLLQDDDELVLYRFNRSWWRASAVNDSRHVLIGESDGIFTAEGPTAEAAVASLIEQLKERLQP